MIIIYNNETYNKHTNFTSLGIYCEEARVGQQRQGVRQGGLFGQEVVQICSQYRRDHRAGRCVFGYLRY